MPRACWGKELGNAFLLAKSAYIPWPKCSPVNYLKQQWSPPSGSSPTSPNELSNPIGLNNMGSWSIQNNQYISLCWIQVAMYLWNNWRRQCLTSRVFWINVSRCFPWLDGQRSTCQYCRDFFFNVTLELVHFFLHWCSTFHKPYVSIM